MHEITIRERAVTLLRQGVSNRVVAETLGVPRGTVGWWRSEDRRLRGEVFTHPTDCPRCTAHPLNRGGYAFLLGLYLGDGHIVSKPRQHRLSVVLDDAYPGVIDAAERAMRDVIPSASVSRRRRSGCTEVTSYTRHWCCMFPQHGRGKKHDRTIALEPWQQEIVETFPWEFIRGLVHSDGCRVTNWTEQTVGGVRRRYEYPRYLFTNVSDDIRQLYCDALDRVGVEWRVTRRGDRPYNVSVARRASVALMDARVGAKW